MRNTNSTPQSLPLDHVFRYVHREPARELVDLERKHDYRLDYLQEQVNKLSEITEAKLELARKSGTRHNFLTNSGFRKVTAGVPDDWTSAGAGVTFSQQAVRPGGHRSNYSARIAAGANAGTLTQSVACFPGQRLSMAVWVKVTTGSGYISLTTNGTNPHTNRVSFSSTDGTGGFIALPSLKLSAPMVELPSDATTVTITLSANANSTIDFCEVQYGHGTKRMPSLWVDNSADVLPQGGVLTSSEGSYTPTGTGVLNVTTITPGVSYWTKVGTRVHLWGTFVLDAAAAGPTSFRLSLGTGVTSNIGAVTDASGGCISAPTGTVGEINGVIATDDLLVQILDPDGNQKSFQYWVDYRII